jgi:hypothetical protein
MHGTTPILVTGSHRSGSTWVGKMLSLSPSVGYIREPFGPHHRPGQLAVNFWFWFPYISSENETAYVGPVSDMLAFRYRTHEEIRCLRTPLDTARFLRDRCRFGYYCRRGSRPLLKDPLALFSAEWLTSRFGVQPVVLIRHPAAFVSSLKNLGWSHPFDHFLCQPLLMRDLLAPYRSLLEKFAAVEQPLLDQAILLWTLMHHTIRRYRERHPDWVFLRHEDLSRQPLQRFEELFGRLGLTFNKNIRKRIAMSTTDANQIEPADPMQVHRASRAGIWNWCHRLTVAEIERIRDSVEPLSGEFYDERSWDPSYEIARLAGSGRAVNKAIHHSFAG